MINKNGQALIMFVVLIPLLLMLMAFVVDTAVAYNRKNEIKNIIRKKEDKEKIEVALKKNNIENYEVKEEENCIIINASVESIFGKIIQKNEYEIIVEKCE